MKEENIIEELKRKVEEGGQVTREEALALSRVEDKKALYEAAGAIRDRFAGRYFDTCSIVNARSGRCSENCKWCAQSAVFKTHVQEYELIDEESCMELARLNAKYGVNKFSFVTSGRSLSDKNIDKLCEYAVKIKQEMKINLCASMGLLTREQLKRLKDAGITRYHCNLETSRRYFSALCTSHTTDEKIETIRHACLSWGWKCVPGYHRHGRDDGRSRGLGADGTGVGREIYPDERAEPDSGYPAGRSGTTRGRGGADDGGCFPFHPS